MMASLGYEWDLVVLVADKNMESAIKGILTRPYDLGIYPIKSKIFIQVERDPGCFQRGHDFLRPMVTQYVHGLVIFDRKGSGQEGKSRIELEQIVEKKLSANGWENRATAIVMDPELEIWIWSDSPKVDQCLGWQSQQPDLRSWLRDQGVWPQNAVKPSDPKAVAEKALREVRKPRSSAIYEQLAKHVSFGLCTDPAFEKFRNTLRKWFPLEVTR